MGLKPNPLDLSSFSALTLLVLSFDHGTLNLTQSIMHIHVLLFSSFKTNTHYCSIFVLWSMYRVVQ